MIGDHIPKVDYRTLLDTYLDFCFYMQLLTMFATVLVHYVHSGLPTPDPVLAEQLNLAIFAIELAAAYVFHEWIYYKFCNNELDIEHWVQRASIIEQEERDTTSASLLPTTPYPATPSANSSPRPVSQQSSNMPVIESSTPNTSSFDVDQELMQLMRKKRRSTLVRFLQALAFDPEKHNLDDGSHINAIVSSEHFIHFGAVQISKKVLTGIKSRLESSLAAVQERSHHVRIYIIYFTYMKLMLFVPFI